MQLRIATAADAALLSRLHAESWRAAYGGMVPQDYLDTLLDGHWTEKFTQWLSDGWATAQIAALHGVDVGCVLYGPARNELFPGYLPGWGELMSLYILPEFWRQGCGAALLGAAVDAFRAADAPGCFLWALRENTRARAFYEKQGFVQTRDTFSVPLGGTVLTDLRYVLPL